MPRKKNKGRRQCERGNEREKIKKGTLENVSVCVCVYVEREERRE
jgi:hypothetical protein